MRSYVLLAFLVGCAATAPQARQNPLREISAWAIQLQGLDKDRALERLESTEAGLVVIRVRDPIDVDRLAGRDVRNLALPSKSRPARTVATSASVIAGSNYK